MNKTDPRNAAMSIRKNTDGHQHSTVSDGAIASDFFASGIENQALDLIQLAGPPGVQFPIDQPGGSTDPSTEDVQSSEFLGNRSNFPGRDAMDIHFG